ncbi:flagellar hook-basal body protein [Aquitalea sp. S1-19]|nr:flagellar hook-basal body protein [Aquitalea sp. S1-19]RQW24533.1 flagellar hook-basal body protein [Rhodobacteraceae bacterium CH30]
MLTNPGLMLLSGQSAILRDMATLAQPANIASQPEGAADSHSFSDAMMAALQSVDAQGREASDKMTEVDSGRSNDLVGAMILSQEAGLSFSMLTQVRNKVVSAVDDLIKMPV